MKTPSPTDYYQDKFRKLIRKVIRKHPDAMNAELAEPLQVAMRDAGVTGSEIFIWQQESWRQLQARARKRSKIKTKLVTNKDGSKVRIVTDERQGSLPL
jgi:hypothetical protein